MRIRRFVRQADSSAYKRKNSPTGNGEWFEHLDGTEWFEVDVPPRWHRCWPQSRAWMHRELVERCACGSLRFDGHGPWIDRNSREPMTAGERADRERYRVRDGLIEAYLTAERAEDWDRCREIRAELQQLE